MTINSNGICTSCGRDYADDVTPGSECPETDDCPSHVEEKGKIWWADEKTHNRSMIKPGVGHFQI